MDAQLVDQNLARVAPQQPAQDWKWIVVAEEDWPGVNDCGAIFVPDREMRFEIDAEEWPASNNC